ncbi:hypothetical protein HHK36_010040 [Tetracentron sinense]|uniref:Uncharacterized protein n=1 Tax=Tetracentron sinense TaxID=13715 RepID=A0A834ZMP7_TETSI|nr:hypothetical protein HHK36_010040 [Tetracentron sinense]
MEYLAMKTDPAASQLINSDLKELAIAAKKLANHAVKLGGLGLGTSFLAWIASFAAIGQIGKWIAFIAVVLRLFFPRHFPGYDIRVHVIRSNNEKTRILREQPDPTAYAIWCPFSDLLRNKEDAVDSSDPSSCESQLPACLLHIDWLEMPGSLILILVVAPSLFADTLRDSWIGVAICLAIGCYLLQEHIRASGGFRNSFTKSHGISNTVGIILLLVYPVWALVLDFI